MNKPFKTTVKTKLIEAAISYSKLLNKKIIIASDSFKYAESYIIRFFETNFLHLTGVSTKLQPSVFFDKCFRGLINEKDFSIDDTPSQKGLIRLKMRHLPYIGSFFDGDLFVQENFEKGLIRCLVATSDGRCTIGFVDAKYNVRPKTILDKNHLDKNKPIITVTPVID